MVGSIPCKKLQFGELSPFEPSWQFRKLHSRNVWRWFVHFLLFKSIICGVPLLGNLKMGMRISKEMSWQVPVRPTGSYVDCTPRNTDTSQHHRIFIGLSKLAIVLITHTVLLCTLTLRVATAYHFSSPLQAVLQPLQSNGQPSWSSPYCAVCWSSLPPSWPT